MIVCAFELTFELTASDLCSAWGLSTNTAPLVSVNDTEADLPLSEGNFNSLASSSAVGSVTNGSGYLGNGASAIAQSAPMQQELPTTVSSRLIMGWPEFDKTSRTVILENVVASQGALTQSGGNLSLMSQGFGIVARVIELKQAARMHHVAGPFDPACTPEFLEKYHKLEETMAEWWAALPGDLIQGTAWDSLADDEREYSEVVPGVLLTFLMARMALMAPDDIAYDPNADQQTLAIRKCWMDSEYFMACVSDAQAMGRILRKLYVRNPEALDYMKGLVVVGVYNSASILLEVLRQFVRAGGQLSTEGAIDMRRDIGYHVRSLRGVQHSVLSAGKLADAIEKQMTEITSGIGP